MIIREASWIRCSARPFFRVLLFVLFFALAAPGPSRADPPLFDRAGWSVVGASDTGQNPSDIAVSVEGVFVGLFSELRVHHFLAGQGFPQILAIKGNGSLRPALPGGDFGGTFYTGRYWDCVSGLVRDFAILELDIRLDPDDPTKLDLKGKAANLDSLEARGFRVRLFPPAASSVKAQVTFKLVATRDLCVDQTKQAQQEGFPVAHAHSNYLSTDVHDSDEIHYVDSSRQLACADLKNETGLVFANPLPMGERSLTLGHSDALPRNTPTLNLSFQKPRAKFITPQGHVDASSDPNDDNADAWGNWDAAKPAYAKGEKLGKFSFTLEAVPPGSSPCP